MDFSDNICLSCCMLHPTSSLNQLSGKQAQFLHTFLLQDVTSFVICHSCNTRMEEFQLFLDKCKRNINMIKTIQSEHKTSKTWEEPDSTWTSQSKHSFSKEPSLHIFPDVELHRYESGNVPTNSTTITEADANKIDILTNEEILRDTNRITKYRCHKEQKEQKLQESCKNKITIQESYSEPGLDVTPDVSIVMDAANTFEHAVDHEVVEEPVSPPPSTNLMSTCSILHPAGIPLLIPIVTNYGGQDTASTPNNFYSVRSLNADERRRQRNREASRRYRERARGDPELLKRMREQQNARQKKYYARLRMKKQSSGDWDTGEEGEGGEERDEDLDVTF